MTRRGYPDYAVVENNEIIGFIEVKPREGSGGLKIAQSAFFRLCKKYGIPCERWRPGDILPDFFKKARTKWPKDYMP